MGLRPTDGNENTAVTLSSLEPSRDREGAVILGSVSISGNWRIVFRFVDGDAFDVDCLHLGGVKPSPLGDGFS